MFAHAHVNSACICKCNGFFLPAADAFTPRYVLQWLYGLMDEWHWSLELEEVSFWYTYGQCHRSIFTWLPWVDANHLYCWFVQVSERSMLCCWPPEEQRWLVRVYPTLESMLLPLLLWNEYISRDVSPARQPCPQSFEDLVTSRRTDHFGREDLLTKNEWLHTWASRYR